MVTALRSILRQSTPANLTAVAIAWPAYRLLEETSLTNDTEADIAQVSYELLKIVCYCVNSLKSPQIAEQLPQDLTKDGPGQGRPYASLEGTA